MLGVGLLMNGQNSLKLFWESHNVPKGEDHPSGAFVFGEKVCEAPCERHQSCSSTTESRVVLVN